MNVENLLAVIVLAVALQDSACGAATKRRSRTFAPQGPSVSIEVVVKVRPDAIAADGDGRRRLDACARAVGVALTPLHPGSADPDLASYFAARVDQRSADAAIAGLRQCPEVESAYSKPAGEPPERK